MNQILKFAKKFLMSEPFYNDGFEYQIILQQGQFEVSKFKNSQNHKKT